MNPDKLKLSETSALERIANALERLSPPAPGPLKLDQADGYVWQPARGGLEPVAQISRVPLALLLGIDHVRDQLYQNTLRFARGLPANNTLLWGSRGMGKSSLVKAVHAEVTAQTKHQLALIEIHRDDIDSLPQLMALLRGAPQQCLLFCDDLSFDSADTSYKSLKAVLEGGIEGRPENVLFYATSNRRHLMPREMVDNERSTAINPAEAVEEKVSLSDRFGLWLGFHTCSQQDYLDMIAGYVAHFKLKAGVAEWRPAAIEWSATRGARSGRVAWQFVQDLAGRLGQKLG